MRASTIATLGGSIRQAARFLLHLLEMCVAMCLGGVVLSAVIFEIAALLGHPDLRQSAPGASTLLISVDLAVAMTIWMRFRGMAWRPTLEMAGSAVAVGVLTVIGYQAGVTPDSLMLQGVCGTACLAMLVVMLFRFRLYAEPHRPGRR